MKTLASAKTKYKVSKVLNLMKGLIISKEAIISLKPTDLQLLSYATEFNGNFPVPVILCEPSQLSCPKVLIFPPASEGSTFLDFQTSDPRGYLQLLCRGKKVQYYGEKIDSKDLCVRST